MKNKKYIFNRAYETKQKVSDQDEYTQNHIYNQRKCLEFPKANLIPSQAAIAILPSTLNLRLSVSLLGILYTLFIFIYKTRKPLQL